MPKSAALLGADRFQRETLIGCRQAAAQRRSRRILGRLPYKAGEFGQPLRYNGVRVDNRNGIVATNGAAHEMLIEKLQLCVYNSGGSDQGILTVIRAVRHGTVSLGDDFMCARM